MFLVTGNMAIARTRHTATLLQNGTVLIVGTDDPYAEVYDPATGSFTAVGSLSPYGGSPLVEAYAHTASLRADGTVLIAGGFDYVVGRVVNFAGLCVYVTLPGSLAATALFAPESGGFTATGLLNTARDGHSATVLGDDTILVVGGEKRTTFSNGFCHSTGVSQVLSSAELFK
ncbi:MAG TPA: kelch repeat-containing protein, partial [Steroidobacteraceae bacterium]